MSPMWLCSVAAPALKQAIASLAISSGVCGTLGLRVLLVSPLIASSMTTGSIFLPLPPHLVAYGPRDTKSRSYPQKSCVRDPIFLWPFGGLGVACRSGNYELAERGQCP